MILWLFVAWTPVQIKGFGEGELSKYFTTEGGREGSFFLHRFAISVLKGVNGEVEAL